MKQEVKVFRFGTLIETIKAKTSPGDLLHFAGEMFRVFHDSAKGLFIDIEDHTIGGLNESPGSFKRI